MNLQQLQEILVSEGLVHHLAVEDPEWYDNYRTVDAIKRTYDRILRAVVMRNQKKIKKNKCSQ